MENHGGGSTHPVPKTVESQYNGGLAQRTLRRLGGGEPELDSHQMQEVSFVCRGMAEARAPVSLDVE